MGNMNRLKDSFWGCLSGFGIVGDIWRGWIVPVGGSTPDRLKKYESLKRFISGMFFRIWNCGGYLAGVDRSGRGFNPRPAQDRLKLGSARVEGIFYKKDGAKVGNVI